jgi:hypothetical protein
MWTTIECAGHPRDMGLAQGAALARAIRGAVERAGLPVHRSRVPSLRGLTSGPVRGCGAGRELLRHFPHQAERLEGLARRANVPFDSVLTLHLRMRAGGVGAGLLARRASLRASRGAKGARGSGVLLERTLPRAIEGEASWLVRDSRPAVGFRSLDVCLPWLVPAVAGVNEGGLAVLAGPVLWGAEGHSGWSPSLLLTQECLQRFQDLDGALDWCCKRPVEGEQSFVLADASGATATVISTGRERRVQPGSGELHLEGGELPTGPEATAESVGPDRVRLDPMRRSLEIEALGASISFSLPEPQPSHG